MNSIFHTTITSDEFKTVLCVDGECSTPRVSWSAVFLKLQEQFFTLKNVKYIILNTNINIIVLVFYSDFYPLLIHTMTSTSKNMYIGFIIYGKRRERNHD